MSRSFNNEESAVTFIAYVEEGKGSHGEKRIRIIFDGKALNYSNDEEWAPAK